MPKFILKSIDLNGSIATLEFQQEWLPDILGEFERFLKASGFYFNGVLDIVSEEDEVVSKDEYNEEYGDGL